tara:strand:+ start:375 stop:584 length:210 start_codon:yes stop_codon:yes gene_type:complete
MGIKRRVILSKDKDLLDLHAQLQNRHRLKYYGGYVKPTKTSIHIIVAYVLTYLCASALICSFFIALLLA